MIVYNPRKEQNCEIFFDNYIAPHFGGGAMVSNGTFIVVSPKSASEIRSDLSPHINDGEALLVLEVGRQIVSKGYPIGLYNWFKQNISED